MANCSYDCSSCGENCSSRRQEDFLKKPHRLSRIRHVIAVASGKGGVGKSMTCASLAVEAARHGYTAGILDADLTGPSIPKMFGIHGRARGSEDGILPAETETGIQIMSMNLLLEKEDEPVVWRGSLISGTVLQFWTDVIWHDVDYLFIDMPPGTGDVPLTVFQSVPLDGVIVVTSPQDLVGMIVSKCLNMASMMNVPVLGIVENMSYAVCPSCGGTIEVFGHGSLSDTVSKYSVPRSARVPIDMSLAKCADEGRMEDADTKYLRDMFLGIASGSDGGGRKS